MTAVNHLNGSLQPPLEARNGLMLRVLLICRISSVNQDERSLQDQEALYRRWIADHTDLPTDMVVVSSQGSGECLDREEYLRAIELVESDTFDLVITEDLGRICRRVHAHLFCEICEDHQTRLVAINDHVDTGREDWRLGSFFAVMRHEAYNADTSRRIRRSLRNRFSQGGVLRVSIYGYIKPPGATTDAELQKDPAAEPIYAKIVRMLEDGASYSEVADWLNTQDVPTGPGVRLEHWTPQLVTLLIHNPLLKGLRVRNRRMSRRVNSTGRRKSVPAPVSERLERACPHLAFIEPERYDRLIAMLDARNACYKRRRVNGVDRRQNVPKRRTTWPGQHISCGVCGRILRYGGHGQNDHLLCRGAYEYRCWNAVTVDGPLAAKKITEAVLQEVEKIPDFDSEFSAMVTAEVNRVASSRDQQLRDTENDLARIDREIDNVLAFVRDGRGSSSLAAELERLEAKKGRIALQRDSLQRQRPRQIPLPSMDEIRRLVRESLRHQADNPLEFGRLMHRIIPKITVYPFRSCDGGHIVLRARFQLNLAPLLAMAEAGGAVASYLQREIEVDLFDPPQRIACREPVMQGRSAGKTERQVASELGITNTAAQRAAALSRQMEEAGLTDPYVRVLEPPSDYNRLRRHRHPRYRFEPLLEPES